MWMRKNIMAKSKILSIVMPILMEKKECKLPYFSNWIRSIFLHFLTQIDETTTFFNVFCPFYVIIWKKNSIFAATTNLTTKELNGYD